MRVDYEVIFHDGTARRLTECERGILDMGEELIPPKGRRHYTVYSEDSPPGPGGRSR